VTQAGLLRADQGAAVWLLVVTTAWPLSAGQASNAAWAAWLSWACHRASRALTRFAARPVAMPVDWRVQARSNLIR